MVLIEFDSNQPIYVQIAEWLETEILAERILEGEKIYSQYQLADQFNINPATAGKGLSLLAEENIVQKKRGLGMFVTTGAKEKIQNKRKNIRLKNLLHTAVIEASHLGVSREDLYEMLNQTYKEVEGD